MLGPISGLLTVRRRRSCRTPVQSFETSEFRLRSNYWGLASEKLEKPFIRHRLRPELLDAPVRHVDEARGLTSDFSICEHLQFGVGVPEAPLAGGQGMWPSWVSGFFSPLTPRLGSGTGAISMPSKASCPAVLVGLVGVVFACTC